jgi:hypothetical protein
VVNLINEEYFVTHEKFFAKEFTENIAFDKIKAEEKY